MRPLVIKVTCAADDPERSNQAFTVAAAAAAAGADVSLWLTGDAAAYGVAAGGPDLGLQHATPVAQLLEVVLAAGRVTVCTQCAARRGITEARPGAGRADGRRGGVRRGGARRRRPGAGVLSPS